ncbi:MAG: hypothetical protein PHS04_06415 [Tissierellia bacterium]|nr:hypothetical protein [Tissierellia bacterium]
MKVYLVGSEDCEMTSIRYICLSKKTALNRWEEIKQELIERANDILELYPNDETELRILKNLQETDPKKMDNYPQEQPFIREMETEE